jgi:hypothetical protein
MSDESHVEVIILRQIGCLPVVHWRPTASPVSVGFFYDVSQSDLRNARFGPP